MKKTLLFLIKNNKVLIIISVFAIFFIAGSIFVGKTDNRFLFTAKEKIPLSVRVFFKDNIFLYLTIRKK